MDSTTAALAKLTAMHGAHQQLGAEFLYRDGWKLPSHYSSSDEEVSRVINRRRHIRYQPDRQTIFSRSGCVG